MKMLLETHAFLWFIGGNPNKDPFDRLIIAQSQFENVPIVSKDKAFNEYDDIQCIWES